MKALFVNYGCSKFNLFLAMMNLVERLCVVR